MGKGINKLRYSYYCSFQFYYFFGCALGIGVAILFLTLYVQTVFLPLPAIIIPSSLVGSCLTLLVLKTFLCMDRQPFLYTGLLGGGVAGVATWGLISTLTGEDEILQVAGAILLVIITGHLALQIAAADRIKIYPDRVTIGKLVLYYRDMKVVKWGVGSLERTRQELTPAQQTKPLEVLTPLLFESRGKDFSITYYYSVIEMPEKIYVVQPVFWRNSLAQNLRNGWLETWRWDGSTEPPAGWVKPD